MTQREWYKVEIPPDMKGHYGEPAMSREYSEEIETWLIDQFRNTTFRAWKEVSCFVYAFRRKEDAMAFKLRFG